MVLYGQIYVICDRMKPYIENLHRYDGETFKFFHRRLKAFPFDWHYHREYELTLTLNSEGRRVVGDNHASYTPFDLVLLGPNVPHSWHGERTVSDDPYHEAFVFWFTQETLSKLIDGFATFQPYQALLEKSRHGVSFDEETARKYHRIAKALSKASEPQQFALLIEVLNLLTENLGAASSLSNSAYGDSAKAGTERTRLDEIIALLHDFEGNHSVDAIAAHVNMSPRTLRRFFTKRIGKSLIDYQIQARLNFAVGHMMTSDDPIYVAAELAGYQNLSHFNRQFKSFFGKTPREFLQTSVP